MKIKHARTLAIGIAIVLVLGLTLFFVWRPFGHPPTQRPRVGPVIESVYGLGTVNASRTYQVKTAVNQKIHDLFVREGDAVRAGAPLIRFDESGVIRAPFMGTVTSVPVKKGELIFPTTPALTLMSLDDLFLEVSLEQQAALKIRPGQNALVSFESLRGQRLEARVQSVFPRENQFIVRISLEQFPPGILPGMTADVAIEVGRKDRALTIPLRAVSAGRITLERAGKRIKVPVQLGVVDGEWAEVTSDTVRPDDDIVVRQL